MPVIIPSGAARGIFHFKSANFFKGSALTILDASLGSLNITEMAEAYIEAFEDHLRPLLSTAVTLTHVQTFTEVIGTEVPANIVGQVGQQAGDPQVCILVRKITQERGPRARGRSYWPGMTFEATFGPTGLMTPADQATYQGRFDDFYEALGTSGLSNLVILQGDEGSSAPLNPPPAITQLLVDQRCATQRRRNRS